MTVPSQDRTRGKLKTCIWWPMWQNDVSEYFKTFDRFQKAKKSTSKRVLNMIKIQETSRPWEIVRMDCVTGLPPGGDQSYNSFLVIVDRFSKTPIFFPCQKDDTAIDTALLICNRVGSWTSIFTNIISDTYHTQTDTLSERMIQNLGDMVIGFFAYVLKLKDCDGLTNDWCTLLPALETSYITSIHASTNQTPTILVKGWNPRIPKDSLRKDLFVLHPTEAIFEGILDKARKHAVRCI
ncbi:hypothetical protein O181_035420 [Austropuccinia psidii MF-1]|uniref:Integrase catalytic domain-containing protein n=1 Tax=Austropuccinia psidii MF-1 TaxID=1389203 RepID=A0A9Q3D4Q7_9BASI|nr:hypothetical protein [Austropuccinia psidii MF-1]